MIRTWLTAAVVALLISTGSLRAAGWQFRWQQGQVLNYRAEQTMQATEMAEGKKTETSQKVNLVKSWKVLAVDAAGVATIQKSLTALRIEQKTFNGATLLFDSAQPDQSDKQMKEQLSKFVGVPLAVLRVDARGKVLEVKECNFGKATQYEVELPFIVALPDAAPQVGQGWERSFTVTLDPPEGTGDKFEGAQKYTLKGAQGSAATVSMTTAFKALPKASADQAPLLQLQPSGEIVFDTEAGRVVSVRLEVANELKDHQGEGSFYSFRRTYAEQLIGN